MHNLPNIDNLQSGLQTTLHPYHSDEAMIPGCGCKHKKSNAIGEVKILGMNPITFTIVAGISLIGIGLATLYTLHHKLK